MRSTLTARRAALAAAVCALVCVCAVFAFLGAWPFGDGTVLTGDLNNQYINYNAQFRRSILAGESVAYSYTKSLGGGMLGILAYYCASPFNLVYLLLAPSAYPQAAGIVLALKIVCASAAMAFWLCRRFSPRVLFVPLGLAWGLCAYVVAYAQNIMWMDVLVLLPLICRGIDLAAERRRPYLYAAALGLALIANFYIAYMACVFCVLYFLHRLVTLRPDGRAALGSCGAFAAGSLAAGGVSAFLWLPSLADILASKNVGGGMGASGTAFKFSEFFHRLMPFSFVWEDVQDGLPNVYCGALAVVLALVYFCAAGISVREKLASGGVLALLFVSMWSEAAMLAMHGFTVPVWFPYRNSFLFSFWLLFLAASAVAHGRLTPVRTAVCAGLGAAFLAACFFVRHVWYTATLFGAGALFCAVYAACVLAGHFARGARVRAAAVCVCGVLCAAEVTANACFVMDQFEKYTKSGYDAFYSASSEALAALGEQNSTKNARRVEKSFSRGYNDPMLLGYNGISHFGSTQTVAVTDLLSVLGYGNVNSYLYGSTAFADSVLGIGALFGADEYDFPAMTGGVPAHYEKTGEAGGLTLYENPYAFPLGCFVPDSAADAELPEEFSTSDTFDVQNAWFAALGGEGALFTDCAVTAPEGEITGGETVTVTPERDGLVYLVLESETDSPVQLSGDVMQMSCFAGSSAAVLHLGSAGAGETKRITLAPSWGTADVTRARAAELDEQALSALAQTLQSGAGETHLSNAVYTSRVSSETGGLYWMNIPCGEGLVCRVDGEETPMERVLGSFCGVRLSPGEHEITVTFTARGAKAGAAVSAVCALALAGAWAIGKRKERRA